MTCTTPPDWSPTTDGRTSELEWEPDLSWPAQPECWDFRPEQIGLYGVHAEAAESAPVPPVSPALAGLAQYALSDSAAPGARTADLARVVQSPRLWYTKKRYAVLFLALLVLVVVFGLSRVGGADSATASAAGATSASSAVRSATS